MILELIILDVIKDKTEDFEKNFKVAEQILAKSKGYISHELQKCIEQENRYVLMIKWETLEDHTIGFRESENFKKWRELLHHFYDPKPIVQHYKNL